MTDKPAVLHEWSVIGAVHDATGLGTQRVTGTVYGSPRHPEGSVVVLSRVVRTEGRVVHTSRGSTYRLGRVSKKHRKFLRDNNLPWDRWEPVKTT